MKQHRILIATDVPFWRRSTGAQVRIRSLVDYLVAESFVVRTFYLGQTNSQWYTEDDRRLIAEQKLDIEQQSSDQMPTSWHEKIGWYANQIRPKLSGNSGGNENDEAVADQTAVPPTSSLRLEDFRWPWASKAFGESIDRFQPDSILIQYVKLSYLIDALTPQQRNSIHCALDTHDALHVRCEMFEQRGLAHWIDISREEEATELDKFDTVIAIQPEEAELFEQMAPHANVIVCGHAAETSVANADRETTMLSIGYLGSTNDSNAQAIEDFLANVWQLLQKKLAQKTSKEAPPQPALEIELVIGGSISQRVAQKFVDENSANVRLLGFVDDITEFYNAVDVVINPVEFGTGLKIKSVEGLAFGKPLLTTPAGVVGVEPNDAIIVCQSAEQFRNELEQLARNPGQLASLKQAAAKAAKSKFSPQQVYSPLERVLFQGK